MRRCDYIVGVAACFIRSLLMYVVHCSKWDCEYITVLLMCVFVCFCACVSLTEFSGDRPMCRKLRPMMYKSSPFLRIELAIIV